MKRKHPMIAYLDKDSDDPSLPMNRKTQPRSNLMERNLDREACIIVNDLDSLMHRIEMLQAHPRYTDALVAVEQAKKAILDGKLAIHLSRKVG
jgi:hypothetical protein